MKKISKMICVIILVFSFSNIACMQVDSAEETFMVNDGLGTLERVSKSKGFYRTLGFLLGLTFDGIITAAECLEFLTRCYPCGKLHFDECEKILSRVGK